MWTLHKLNERKRTRSSDDALPSSEHQSGLPDEGWEEREAFDDPNSRGPWGFSEDDLERFPALRKRNFWCIQRHQARALHYDLRMQLDGGTFSWAIPRGLLGVSKSGERNRLAVETSVHPISYTVHEGADGRTLPSGEKGGTLLWDVGTYTIDYPFTDYESDSEQTQRRKRRKAERSAVFEDEDSEDPLGTHEEDKFRLFLTRTLSPGKSRSIHFTLKAGYKLTNHSYILILNTGRTFGQVVSRDGRVKKNWFVSLPRGVEGYSWGSGGEEGEQYGRSVKTGRTLKEICASEKLGPKMWSSEWSKFASWIEDAEEVVEEGETKKQSQIKP